MRKLRAVLLTAIALSTVAAHADYKMAFREGVRAYEKQRWPAVVTNMSAALAQQKASGEMIAISGGWSERYNPHDFLAAAYAKLGQCEDASRTWRGSSGAEKFRRVVESSCAGATAAKPDPVTDYKAAFREGVRAYEKQQWGRVITHMRAAMEARASSDENVIISGGWNERYAPASFLAAALVKQACTDAWTALENATGNAKLRKVVTDACGQPAVQATKR